ncbi:MAG TPA: hypothetical protein VGV59_07905 [Pyrinomonadaceae bacterium]|nr:hypothetical protein [Pyrinomonadaceae bacterium]
MRSLARTPFGAIFQTEVLLNTKRVAPYAMIALFAMNGWLWTVKGAAASYGWATNSEFYIARNFAGFSFLTLPLFNALIMGDPVIRDFRLGISPLIFSRPVGRAEYLLGKFFGNFFVLICCQAAFALTLFVLQAFPTAQMITQPARVWPYFKHFFFFVVISHLCLAAIYFTVGTLTRNAKIVYGLAVSFYPLYIVYQLSLKGLPLRWRIALDPLLLNWSAEMAKGRSPEWLDQLVISYDSDLLLNRALVVLVAAVLLAFLYLRFSMVERFGKYKDTSPLTTINLAASADWLDRGMESASLGQSAAVEESSRVERVAISDVNVETEGVRAKLRQLAAAFEVELRLLYAERSLVVLAPLATLLCVVGLVYYKVDPDSSYSATYAGRTAESLLLFLCALAVFYMGEAMHRDRELRFEPVLWSVAIPNFVLLLSKFAATLLLSLSLSAVVGLTAFALQIYQGHTPLEPDAYLKIYTLILIPSMLFLIAAATALNVLLRDKYLAYAVSFGMAGGLFYLYSQGYNHWLYNPVLYGLWTPADITGAATNQARIINLRLYCLALAFVLLALAHLFFERKSTKR